MFALLFGNTASAQFTLGTYFTDLWWNPAESGWGVTVDHQNDVMFLTFFVYGANGSPYWVTGILYRTDTSPIVPHAFSGDMHETRGPYFGDTFDPGRVSQRPVGHATFTGIRGNAAQLQYSIDGVTVTKALERQTLRHLDFSGIYNGISNYVLSNCLSPINNGMEVHDAGNVTIAQSGTTFRLSFDSVVRSSNCSFFGSYSQTGSIGSATGTMICNDGTSGTFLLDIMQWTITGWTARITAQTNACDYQGIVGGIGLH
jgi:hypothetical protein